VVLTSSGDQIRPESKAEKRAEGQNRGAKKVTNTREKPDLFEERGKVTRGERRSLTK